MEESWFENFTEPEDPEEDGELQSGVDADGTARMTMAGLYVVIFLFSFVGNSLIFHLVRTRKSIRKNQFYWLIVNTAVADLIDVISASVLSILYFVYRDDMDMAGFGIILCQLMPYLLIVSICAAIWTLTVIAVDRYLVIVCLRRRALSSRSVLCSIFTVWLCAALVSSGQLYKYKIEEDEDGVQYCYEQWDEDEELNAALYKTETILKVIVTYAVPLLVMAVLYSLIARFLWKRKPPVSVNQQAYNNQVRKRKTVIKMLVTVVTVFALCWFPVHVSHVMPEFYSDAYSDVPVVLRWLFFWLAHANAAIHPWLFVAFSEHLREGTKEIFRNIRKRRKQKFRTGSTPSLATNEDPLSRSVTPKGNCPTSPEQDI